MKMACDGLNQIGTGFRILRLRAENGLPCAGIVVFISLKAGEPVSIEF